MPSNSLSYIRFSSRCSDIRKHLATVRASLSYTAREVHQNRVHNLSLAEVLDLTASQHPYLNKKTDGFRNACRRAEVNTYEFAFHRLYSFFGEYCKGILKEAFLRAPMLIIEKSDASLKFHEIVKLGSYDAIGARMVETVFRRLEGESSSRRMLERLVSGMGVELPAEPFATTLGYLEARHLIVHNAGLTDKRFCDQYIHLFPGTVGVGAKLNLNSGVTFKAIDSVDTFLKSVDEQIVSAGFAEAKNGPPP